MPVQTYSSSQVAKAAGMTHENFRKQFSRFHDGSPGNGKAHQFTLDQATVYALARRLMECGFKAFEAFLAADFQSTRGACTDPKHKLFDPSKGDTYFIAFPQAKTVGCTIKESEIRDHPRGMFISPKAGDVYAEQIVLINLTALRDRIAAELEDG